MEFLDMDLTEDGDTFEIDKRAVSALGMNGVDGEAGGMVDDAIFHLQFAFDVVEVDWAADAVIDADPGWSCVERMMLRFQTVRHERAMQDLEVQAAVHLQFAIDPEAAELQVSVGLHTVDGEISRNYGAHAIGSFNHEVGIFGQIDGKVAFIQAVVYDVNSAAESVQQGVLARRMPLHPGGIAGFPLLQGLLKGTDFSAFKHVDTLAGSQRLGRRSRVGSTAEVATKAVAVIYLDCIVTGWRLLVKQAQAAKRDINSNRMFALLAASETRIPLAQVC